MSLEFFSTLELCDISRLYLERMLPDCMLGICMFKVGLEECLQIFFPHNP